MKKRNFFLISNNKVKKIIIILDNKNNSEIDELNLSFTNDIKLYEKYFTYYELDELKKIDFDKVELKDIIEFSNIQINLDDTIYMLCYKIREILQIDNKLSEFYLYTYEATNFEDINIDDYNYHLVKKLEEEIDFEKNINENSHNYDVFNTNKIKRYIHNNYQDKVINDELNGIEGHSWFYSKLKDFQKEKKYKIEKIPLTINVDDTIDIFVNPFNYNNQYIDEKIKSKHSFNEQLGDFIYRNNDNVTIFICLAEDVLQDKSKEKELLELYYPLLIEENVKTKEELNQIKKEKKPLPNKKKYDITIELKDILFNQKSFISKKKYVIDELGFYLLPQEKMFISLDVLFNIFDTSKTQPLIKYSYGFSSSNSLIKLFVDDSGISMKKTDLIKTLGVFTKKRSVIFLFNYSHKKNIVPVFIEFYEDGKCYISIQNEGLIESKIYNKVFFEESDMNKIMNDVFNVMIEKINKKYNQENNFLPYFKSLYEKKIEHSKNSFSKIIKLQDIRSLFKKLNKIKKKLLPIMKYKEGNELEYVKYQYNGYDTNVRNNKCIIEIRREKSPPKHLKITIANINTINILDNIFDYVEQVLHFLYSGKKLENIEEIELINNSLSIDKEENNEHEDDEENKGNLNNMTNNIEKEKNKAESIVLEDEEDEDDEDEDADEDEDEDEEEDEDEDEDEEVKLDAFGLPIEDNNNNNNSNFGGGGRTSYNLKGGSRYRRGNLPRNYAKDRIDKRDPNFIKYNDKIYAFKPENNWSRKCATTEDRQPIALTEEEVNYIKEENPDSYKELKEDIYQAGSDSEHQNYYICPKYWCLEGNITLTKEQVKEQDGKLISDKCKTSDGEYGEVIEHRTGKQESKFGWFPASRDFCAPCCFKKSKDGKKKYKEDEAKEKCPESKIVGLNNKFNNLEKKSVNNPPNNEDNNSKQSKKKSKKEEPELIKNLCIEPLAYNNFPIEQSKISNIPLNVKLLIKGNTDNIFCLGVEIHPTQSFISCIKTIKYFTDMQEYTDKKKRMQYFYNEEIKSNKEFKKDYLIDKVINLDIFLQLHNGNLPTIFYNEYNDTDKGTLYDKDIKESNFYKKVEENDELKENYFLNIISSYLNFKKYLNDDNVLIDHTYLWDLVSMKTDLFKNGLNVIIIEVDNLELDSSSRLVCPTNYYSSNKFDKKKDSIILIKYENNYEILIKKSKCVTIKKTENNREYKEIELIPSFSFNKETNIDQFINRVEKIYNSEKLCGVFTKELPQEILIQKFNALKVKKILEKYGFKVDKQIIYYNGRVIGFKVFYNREINNDKDNDFKEKKYLFAPCEQSGIINDIDIITMNSKDIKFKDYNSTKQDLEFLYRKTENEYNVLYKNRVESNNKVIGIETHNNFFIPIEPKINSSELINDDLTKVTKDYSIIAQDGNDKNFMEIDKNLKSYTSTKKKKKGRILKLKSILENNKSYQTQIYSLKKLLNNINMRSDKLYIIQILESNKNFQEKYELIYKILIKKVQDKNSENNLDVKYLKRLIDELIRHNQIRKFITIDNKYLMFSSEYNEKKNQILYDQGTLIEKLSKENVKSLYNLDKIDNNKYIKKNKTSETSQPENLYILDYNDGYNFDKLRLDFTIKDEIKLENQEEKKQQKCPRGTRYNKQLEKCIPIEINAEEEKVKLKKKILKKEAEKICIEEGYKSCADKKKVEKEDKKREKEDKKLRNEEDKQDKKREKEDKKLRIEQDKEDKKLRKKEVKEEKKRIKETKKLKKINQQGTRKRKNNNNQEENV